MSQRLTLEEWKQRARNIHGDKYDYSKTEYVSSNKKVCIICPVHGEFWQIASSHTWSGQGCQKCGNAKRAKTQTRDQYDFITQAKKLHNDKYDYSKVEYKGCKVKVCIICPVHGEFWMMPNSHCRGSHPAGCPRCKGLYKPLNEVLDEFKVVHGDKYDYSKVEYKGCKVKVCIICPVHGEFWLTPNNHASGKIGCSKCCESKGERKIRMWLEKNKIEYEREKSFDGCVAVDGRRRMRFDFYIPKNDICIEFDGIQHFEEGINIKLLGRRCVGRFLCNHKMWLNISHRDNVKNQFCLKNNIKLLRISYKQLYQIDNILSQFLKGIE